VETSDEALQRRGRGGTDREEGQYALREAWKYIQKNPREGAVSSNNGGEPLQGGGPCLSAEYRCASVGDLQNPSL